MAGMFYTIIEVAEKLGKTEADIRGMVGSGQLREFRDGAKLLFKKDEVDALAGDAAVMADDTLGVDDQAAVEGSTMGLSAGQEDAPATEEQLTESDIDIELDASGLDMALGGSDIDLDLAGSRAAEDLDLSLDDQDEPETSEQPGEDTDIITEQPQDAEPAAEPESDIAPAMQDEPEYEPEEVPVEEEVALEPDASEEAEPVQTGQESELEMSMDLVDEDVNGSGLADISDEEGTKFASEGISVLDQSDENYAITEDTLGETAEIQLESGGLGEEPSLDDDVNLESFGSGSGLLDLSLQADDTSLGAVLDDIIPGAGGGDDIAAGEMDMAAEADDVLAGAAGSAQQAPILPDMPAQTGVAAMAYIEPAPDASSNAFGISLLVPMIVLIYTIIIAIAGAMGVVPGILTVMKDMMIWYIAGGMLVLAFMIMGIGAMSGGGSAKPKKAKQKKMKPKKIKKKK